MTLRRLVFSAIAFAPALPDPASAHARWFIDDAKLAPSPPFIMDGTYAALIAGAVLFAAAAVCLELRSRQHAAIFGVLSRSYAPKNGLDWRALACIFGYSLIMNSLSHVFIAPNLPVCNSAICTFLFLLQILIGTIFILQSRLIIGGAGLMLLPVACTAIFSFGLMIDYALELAGLGLAFYLIAPALSISDQRLHKQIKRAITPREFEIDIHTSQRSVSLVWAPGPLHRERPSESLMGQRAALAVTMLRASLGLQLVILAAHDKFLEPAVSLAFVDKTPFLNFMPAIGLAHFTNLHFVFAAGLAETTLGLLLLTNVASRAASLALAAMFSVSAVVFGLTEALGHLPILGALLLVALHGSEHAKLGAIFENWEVRQIARQRGAVAADGLIPSLA